MTLTHKPHVSRMQHRPLTLFNLYDSIQLTLLIQQCLMLVSLQPPNSLFEYKKQ